MTVLPPAVMPRSPRAVCPAADPPRRAGPFWTLIRFTEVWLAIYGEERLEPSERYLALALKKAGSGPHDIARRIAVMRSLKRRGYLSIESRV